MERPERLASAVHPRDDVVPVDIDGRRREDPVERFGDLELDVLHGNASSYERRSAAWAVASVAETVPTATYRRKTARRWRSGSEATHARTAASRSCPRSTDSLAEPSRA